MAHVYGIGNPLIDYLCSIEDKDISALGLSKGTMLLIDTEKRQEILDYTRGRDIVYSCGGSCPNTMVTLCSLGVPTTLAGSVCQDELGDTYKNRLKESGVKDHLVQKKEGVTGTSIILLTADKERTMNTYLGANRLFSPEDVVEEEILASDLFYFTGYMWDTEAQQKAVMKAIDICKANGKKIAFDIADPFAVGRYRAKFLELIENYCDIVFANSEEARALIDNYDTYECCRTIGKICNIAIVKDGKKGSYISDGGVITKISIEPKKPLDTTGAGDTYAAGFLFGYLTGRDNITSCHIASYLSGEIICQLGAQFPASRIPELQTYINEKYPV
ncbi:MAG: adenosine kinase [Spirochaetales bacterium]|nr:adenosine kinase [Candidatus Physcosoma equi]